MISHKIFHPPSTSHSHSVGNRWFRKLVDSQIDHYTQTKSRREKSQIVTSIVESIRKGAAESSSGGGFVRKDLLTRRWFTVNDKLAREKVSKIEGEPRCTSIILCLRFISLYSSFIIHHSSNRLDKPCEMQSERSVLLSAEVRAHPRRDHLVHHLQQKTQQV